MYESRPAHPYNITDLVPMAIGATESLIQMELKKHPEGSPRRADFEERLRAVHAAMAAFQGGTSLLH